MKRTRNEKKRSREELLLTLAVALWVVFIVTLLTGRAVSL